METKLRILCIEDNLADFRLLERHLKHHGLKAKCHHVASLEELRAALAQQSWDLVLSDYSVPKLDFQETLNLLQPQLEELPLMLVSGSVGEERAVELLNQGVWDFILKDNLTRLVPAIEHGMREAAERRARRKAEAALRESELKHRMLFESSRDAILTVDPVTHQFLSCNPTALQMFGVPSELDLITHGPAFFSPERQPDGRLSSEKVRANDAVVMQNGSAFFEWRHRRFTGEEFFADVLLTRIQWDGRPAIMASVRDSAERKRAELALQTEADRLTLVLNAQREIAGANLGYTGLLQLILEWMSRMGGAEGATLEMAEGDDMVYQAATGAAAPFIGLRLKSAGSLSGQCMKSGVILRSDDTETDSRVDREACRHVGVRSMILLPLRYDEHAFGALKLMSPNVAAFSSDTEKTLGLMGEFLSATISRKRAEASLSESEANFRAMFETASIGMAQTDPNTGRWLRVNRKLCEMLGYTVEEMLARTIWDITYEPDRETGRQYFQSLVEGKRSSYHLEKRYVHKSGRLVWANANVSILHDATGRPLRTVAAIEDITARRLAEEERIRLSTAVEQASEAIVITDLAARIQYTNPAFERITGYSRQEAIGKNPRMLQSGRHDAAFFRELWSTLSRGEVWHGRFVNQRKDGQLFEEDATITPVRDVSGQIVNYIAIKTDVTREVALEAQFRQSQKLEAIGQLAGGVAHDFNNILAAIMMQAQLSELSDGIPEKVIEDLQQIRFACERAANLTRQLLLFSRKQVIQPCDLDLNQAVTSIGKMLKRIIGENVAIHLCLHSQPLLIHADAGMLDQVLMNLAVNARDAMEGSGKLTIQTAEVVVGDKNPRPHPDSVPGRYVRLGVTDTGSGIPPEVLPRIFEPFFTSKERGKGTGLGLATVFGIVKQHRGWIEVTTEQGKGTSFEVYLPACASAADATIMAKETPKSLRGTETILLTEDDFSLRKIAAKLLENNGYTVLEAADGTEALALWKDNFHRVSLLLTDLLMPGGINGRELSRELQGDRPDLKVIYLSGYSADLLGQGSGLRLGENFLQKPVSPVHLLELIRRQLDG